MGDLCKGNHQLGGGWAKRDAQARYTTGVAVSGRPGLLDRWLIGAMHDGVTIQDP
jgi:hypothetical protein